MRRWTKCRRKMALYLLVALVLTSGRAASAQPPGPSSPSDPIRRPTISPYLNLFNQGGRNTGLNYYNFVRPQQQFRAATSQLQSEVRSLQTGVQGLRAGQGQRAASAPTAPPNASGRMSPTGHAATFGNLSGYFPGSTSR